MILQPLNKTYCTKYNGSTVTYWWHLMRQLFLLYVQLYMCTTLLCNIRIENCYLFVCVVFYIFQLPVASEAKKRRAPKGTMWQLTVKSSNKTIFKHYIPSYNTQCFPLISDNVQLVRDTNRESETNCPAEVTLPLLSAITRGKKLCIQYATEQCSRYFSVWKMFLDHKGYFVIVMNVNLIKYGLTMFCNHQWC